MVKKNKRTANKGHANPQGPSRRSFLAATVAGVSSAWVTANWPGIVEAEAYAQQAARQAAQTGQPARLAFFTDAQAADIDAMASQIYPTDSTPGAHEARVVYFIDRALVTFARNSRPVYIQGLKDLQAKTKELFPSASKFSALTAAQQIQLLTTIEKSPFFTTVRDHTVTGMFASPIHGGNYNKVGWKQIGFEDTLNFKPPFGYYDAARKPRR
jgi:gluconate 2-dehydrogenase gamma chain